MPATRPTETQVILIVALSARALAQSARRAGWRPVTLDLFADTDTQEAADRALLVPARNGLSFDTDALIEMARRPDLQALPILFGGGLERYPEVLEALARGRDWIGNAGATVAAVKDPFRLAALAADCAISHPMVSAEPPRQPGWLAKERGGGGGTHIVPAEDSTYRPGTYYQEWRDGRSISVLFLADRRDARIVGFCEQWTAPTRAQPYRFGGAVGPVLVAQDLAAGLVEAVRRLSKTAGLAGLNSADFLVRAHDFDLLEINPRPGATVELFDRPPLPPLLTLHRDAVKGVLPARLAPPPDARALSIVYASHGIQIGQDRSWPEWVRDRPQPNIRIDADAPLCTVIGQGAHARAARERALDRNQRIMALCSVAAAC